VLLPALAKAKSRAYRIQCIDNEKQMGVGLTLYVDDNSDNYPAYEAWAAFGGQTGTNMLDGALTDPTNRPLNKYTVKLTIYDCPADKGDALNPQRSPNCYAAYGNSYIIVWDSQNRYGVQIVGGDSGVLDDAPTPPIKGTLVGKHASNKIILGDWPWFADRNINSQMSAWHNYVGQPNFNMLFGDTHAEYYKFPVNYAVYNNATPDPSFTWW
jgi:hypothetical protein